MNTRAVALVPVALVGFALLAATVPAAAGFREAAKGTKPAFGIRYRFETVDQDGFERESDASTARVRLGWVMPPSEGVSVGVQADYVANLGAQRYNSTVNGRTEFPVVADPVGFDLNQAFIRYRKGMVTVSAGRQRIAHPGQRFVGYKAWRQNEQSFDALRIEAAHRHAGLDYAYVTKVNRIFGPGDGVQPANWSSDSHLLRASVTPVAGHAFGAFGYLLDFENDNGPANSNATAGLDYAGSFGRWRLSASAGRQRDWGDAPVPYSAPHYTLELRRNVGGTTIAVGWEGLGSDGGVAAVQTPVGAEHIYRGWADKFAAVKPVAGIEDAFLSASAKVGVVTISASLHSYRAWHGEVDYGDEAGVSASFVHKRLSLQGKLTRYRAEAHATDTTKAWLTLTYTPQFGS